MIKLLFVGLVTFAFTILAVGSQREHGYTVADREAKSALLTRTGKLAEPEQYKLAVYLWEGGVRE